MQVRHAPRSARHWLALGVGACIALTVPALAHANSNVSYNGNTLQYAGEDAVNNLVTITLNAAATTYTITDSENITTASGGCTGNGTQTVVCTAVSPSDDELDVDGRDGNDHLTVNTAAAPPANQPDRVEVGQTFPESGDDHIDLSRYAPRDGQAEIFGGPGDDEEIGAAVFTSFRMGNAPDGADTLVGPSPDDTADYEDRTGNLNLNAADGLANDGEAGEHDNISSNVEELRGGLGNDALTAGPADSRLEGDLGNDVLIGGPGSDNLSGGDGTNTMSGGDGDDSFFGNEATNNTIDGGAGDDFIDLENGTNDVHGGPGFDFVSLFEFGPAPDFKPFNLSVILDDLANDGSSGEGTNIHSDIEDIGTDEGDDTIVGTDQPEQIFADLGNDIVNPGGGADQVFMSAGNDSVSAADGVFDRISCGPGADSATADVIDQLSACENVSSLALPAVQTPRDRLAAAVALRRLAKRLARAKFLKSGLSMRVAPSEPVRLVFTLTGHLRGGRIARAGDVVVATKSLGMSGSVRTVRLKPAKSLKRKFARRFKLSLQLLAIDGGGNVTNTRRTISVR
jgi:hypothetical protein